MHASGNILLQFITISSENNYQIIKDFRDIKFYQLLGLYFLKKVLFLHLFLSKKKGSLFAWVYKQLFLICVAICQESSNYMVLNIADNVVDDI